MNSLQTVKKYLFESKEVAARIESMLGGRSEGFKSSIINVVRNSKLLMESDSVSINRSAMVAVTLDLPIDYNLGFAAIVPYRHKWTPIAQFQIMYRGLIQLAIRTGQYQNINATQVYEDEMEHHASEYSQMQQAQKYDQAILRGDINDPEPEYFDNPNEKDTAVNTDPFNRQEVVDADFQEPLIILVLDEVTHA